MPAEGTGPRLASLIAAPPRESFSTSFDLSVPLRMSVLLTVLFRIDLPVITKA